MIGLFINKHAHIIERRYKGTVGGVEFDFVHLSEYDEANGKLVTVLESWIEWNIPRSSISPILLSKEEEIIQECIKQIV